MAGVLVHQGKLTKRAIRSATNWKPRYFKLWRCEGYSPVLEYGKVGSSTPSGFIILSFGTTVRMEENLTPKSKNGIYLKTLFTEDDTPVKRLSAEGPQPSVAPDGYLDSGAEYLDTIPKKTKLKIKRSRSRNKKSSAGPEFVELFAFAATREDAVKWVEVLEKELVRAHGLVTSKFEVQVLSRLEEIKVPSALETLGIKAASPQDKFHELLKKAHDEEAALQAKKKLETSLVSNSVTHCLGAPREARSGTVSGVIDVTEIPYGIQPKGQNWTVMYQGNVRRLFDMCRIAKVVVPQEGAFIRNRVDGRYFQITGIKSGDEENGEDAPPQQSSGMFDLKAKMLAKLKAGKITEAEYNHIMQVPQLHTPMTNDSMEMAQNLPTSHNSRLLNENVPAGNGAGASGPKFFGEQKVDSPPRARRPKSKSKKGPPVPKRMERTAPRIERYSSSTVKPSTMQFKNGKWISTEPLIPTTPTETEAAEAPSAEHAMAQEPPTPPPPEGKKPPSPPTSPPPPSPPPPSPPPPSSSPPSSPPPPAEQYPPPPAPPPALTSSSDEDSGDESVQLVKPPPSTESMSAQI